MPPSVATATAALTQGPKASAGASVSPSGTNRRTSGSYANSIPASRATAATTSGRVIRTSVAGSMPASSAAATSESAGNIGRMYDGSFDPDALKNTNTNAAQTSAKRRHANPLAARGASRQARRAPQPSTGSHGSMPATNTGMKYHHGSTRRCSVVR